jgi:hypothetical protein
MKTIDLLHDNITGLEIYQKYVIMFQLFKYLFFLMKEWSLVSLGLKKKYDIVKLKLVSELIN